MNKNNINILDCTLRDGGYVIDWNFGEKNIQSLLNNLVKSNIEYIECGFLKAINQDKNKTFWQTPENFLSLILPEKKYTLMVNYGEYDITNFEKNIVPNITIRVAFKKHNQKDALVYIKNLRSLGWNVFANPMNTNTYNENELHTLIEDLNKKTGDTQSF